MKDEHVALHQTLWNQNDDLIRQCVEHPFVEGLGNGDLDVDAFRRYVAQDVFFLNAFVKAYALALAKSDTIAQADCLHGFIGGVLDELKLHARYADSLDIDLKNVRPFPETLAYTEFLQAIAWHGELPEILAAMAPCMTLYHHLGTSLLSQVCESHPFKDWIESYSSPEFTQLCQDLERLLDEVASNTPSVRKAYRYAMQCEFDFFTAPMKAVQESCGKIL